MEGSLGASLLLGRFYLVLKKGSETDDRRQCMTENRVIHTDSRLKILGGGDMVAYRQYSTDFSRNEMKARKWREKDGREFVGKRGTRK